MRAGRCRNLFPVLASALTGVAAAGSGCISSEPGGTEAPTEGPCRLHSLRSACQQLHNPITSSGSGTTSLECQVIITIQNDKMQREAVRKRNQVSDVWKV